MVYRAEKEEEFSEKFRSGWDYFMTDVVKTAQDHGFCTDPRQFSPPTAIALMHEELSEALNADRRDNPPDDHCPEFDSISVEFADLLIRMMVFANTVGLDIPGALFAKAEYNKSRPFKHGKKY
jgi:NTP pyrophosphatase (non-canonical NTP hydrolase)